MLTALKLNNNIAAGSRGGCRRGVPIVHGSRRNAIQQAANSPDNQTSTFTSKDAIICAQVAKVELKSRLLMGFYTSIFCKRVLLLLGFAKLTQPSTLRFACRHRAATVSERFLGALKIVAACKEIH